MGDLSGMIIEAFLASSQGAVIRLSDKERYMDIVILALMIILVISQVFLMLEFRDVKNQLDKIEGRQNLILQSISTRQSTLKVRTQSNPIPAKEHVKRDANTHNEKTPGRTTRIGSLKSSRRDGAPSDPSSP